MAKLRLFICFCIFALNTNAQQSTIIEGSIKSPYNEPVSLMLYKHINIAEAVFYKQTLVDSNFKFNFKLTDPAYFILTTNRNTFKLFLIEPGDSIHIDMNILKVQDVKFSGAGSDKANYQHWAHIRYQDWYHPPVKMTSDTGQHYFKYLDSCRLEQLYSLRNFKGLLTPMAYEILKADVFYGFENLKSKYLSGLFSDSTYTAQAHLLYTLYSPIKKKFIFSDTLVYSRNLMAYLVQQNEVDSQYLQQENWAETYKLAKQQTRGKIQERLLAIMLMNPYIPATNGEVLQCAKDYLTGNYDPLIKELVRTKYGLYK